MKHFTSYCQWALVGVLVGWFVVSLLIAPGLYLGDTLSGQTISMLASLGQAFLVTDVWAVLALLVLLTSRNVLSYRIPFKTWLASQFALGIAFIIIVLLLAHGEHWRVLGLDDILHVPSMSQALLAGLPRGFVIYLIVWALCQACLLLREYNQIRRRLVGIELRRLRTQLNPHFLYNALNAISELGYKDPDAADRTVTRLSGLLRKSLDDSHQQEIALRDELDFLQCYLDIQHTLLEDRLHVELAIDEAVLNARVPGMILQPLVENAMTHGVGSNGEVHLVVRAVRDDDSLLLDVQDKGPGRATVHEGIGIGNTRARLRYLYGELAGLELLNCPDEGLIARLIIPFHEAYAYDENPHPDC